MISVVPTVKKKISPCLKPQSLTGVVKTTGVSLSTWGPKEDTLFRVFGDRKMDKEVWVPTFDRPTGRS